MQSRRNADWPAATPFFLFPAPLAVLATVLDLPLALRIVLLLLTAALLGVGGALLGRSLCGTGWRPSDDHRAHPDGAGIDPDLWLPSQNTNPSQNTYPSQDTNRTRPTYLSAATHPTTSADE